MSPDAATDAAGNSGQFHTTRWSLILTSLDETDEAEDGKARQALTELCRIYWRPIFAYISRQGYSPVDAQDLTQEFFLAILKKNLLQRADPERGRFRSLLLKSLQNFLHDARSRAHTRKRGGDVQFVAWDEWMAEAPSRLTISPGALKSWPAERLFDVRWAATIAERALRSLQDECERRGRRRAFDALSGSLVADRSDVSYEDLARQLTTGTTEIKRLLHQLRRRYGQLLRAEVAETVEKSEDIEDELRYLVRTLATSAP